jgi:ATP-binding cassette subfamily F protein uup
MDKIVDHLFVFRGKGLVDNFPGNYSDYRTYEDSISLVSDQKKMVKTSKPISTKQSLTKLSFNEQKELKNIESKLESLEFDKKELESQFLVEDISIDTIELLSMNLKKILEVIEEKEQRWIDLNEKLN